MKNEVELEAITLEPQLAEHAAELFPLLCEREAYEFTDSKPPESEEELRERFRQLETGFSPDGAERWLNWVIRRSTGEAAGYVQATIAANGSAEIAFVLGSHHWGHGLAFSAMTSMLDILAREFGVRSFSATADAANTRSMNLLTRLGFEVTSCTDTHNIEFSRNLSVPQ